MKRASVLLLSLALAGCSPTPSKPIITTGDPAAAEPPPVFAPASGTADVNDITLFLAGKAVHHGASLSQMQMTANYKSYSDSMRYRWRYYASRRTLKQSMWSDENLAPTIGSPGTLLYPFGGPDLLHAIGMFPHTSTYVLLGLEPAGSLPMLEGQDPGAVLGALSQLSRSVDTQLKVGYFITKDMRGDLANGPLQGVTPILLSTIGLMNGTVQNIQSLSAGGKPAVQIDFRIPGSGSKRVIYVSGDLSNSGFNGGYRSWLSSYGGSVAYFKAASYLMHDDGFSGIRNFVLSNCHAVVQDDSGIPFRYYSGWQTKLFGSYDTPIELFANHGQADLRAAYAAAGPVPQVPFGSGYQVRGSNANLQLFKR
ncbi:hypothetical protein [Luteolibacter sp. LG18]|uniref:hypothetical protein n=1 Tax=Luteolibacter sp. LG18 TaxID=2819286 RepID=UPI002B2C3675|nr:hypothetical protein llg_22400 [Luteolibacter sp. LG18]